MYNDTLSPLFPLSLDNGNTSDPLAGIRCTGKNKDPASVVGPMRKPVDPIFDNTRASQDSHLVFESPNLLNVPTIYSLYADAYLEHSLFFGAHEFVHRDTGRPSLLHPFSPMANTGADEVPVSMLDEMGQQSVPEMKHVDRSAVMFSSTFLDCDVVTAWSGTIRAPYQSDYSSLGLSSCFLESTPHRNLTGSTPEDLGNMPESWTTDVPPTVVNEPYALPVSVLSLSVPMNWRQIPQRRYSPKVGNRSFSQLQAVAFSVNGVPGFNMQRAYNQVFSGLDGRDGPVLENANGPVSCRLLFPGYPINTQCSQIAVKNWKREPAPIMKSKLAHEVAKRVYQYLNALAAIPMDPSADLRWTIGQGHMKFEKMYLTKISWVSRGSVQPEIWVDTDDS